MASIWLASLPGFMFYIRPKQDTFIVDTFNSWAQKEKRSIHQQWQKKPMTNWNLICRLIGLDIFSTHLWKRYIPAQYYHLQINGSYKVFEVSKDMKKGHNTSHNGMIKGISSIEKINSNLLLTHGTYQKRAYEYVWHLMLDSITGFDTDVFLTGLIGTAFQKL